MRWSPCLPAVCLLAAAAAAQTATPLPLSGRTGQGGAVTSTQLPVPGATSSVDTLNPSVQPSGAYAGSVGSAAAFNGRLSLREAVQRGLDFNLGAVGANLAVKQAAGQARSAKSALLPNLNGLISDTEQQTDLAATGFHFNSPFPGFQFPSVVGPFNYSSLQAALSQNVADFTALNNYRASQQTVRALQLQAQDARDLVVLAVGGAYLQVLTAQARLDAAHATLATANAIYDRSVQQKSVGAQAQLAVDQNQLQVMLQQQQLTTLQNDLAKQKINLARLIGAPLDAALDLTDTVPYAPAPALALAPALQQALQQRADLKAAAAQVEAARIARTAARDERLPALVVSGNYGLIGNSPWDSSHGVFTAQASLNIPLWQGGRATGDLQQADAVMAQRQAEAADTRGLIEAQVREAFLDLQAAASQVELARKNTQVAHETLDMTRLRFEAGVINTVELVQAQQSVATAEQDYINSVFAHNVAKLTLARALGNAKDHLGEFLSLSR